MDEIDELFLKIIVLGEKDTGKTALMKRYCTGEYPNCTQATVGMDYLTKTVFVGDTYATMEIWDTAGQERFHAVNSVLYRETHCCVLVYDVTSKSSFKAIAYWRDQVLTRGSYVDDKVCPFVVIGNKLDMIDGKEPSKLAQEWCRERKIPVFGCSAKDDINVETAFKTAARLALEEKRRVDQYQVEKILQVDAKKKKSSKC